MVRHAIIQSRINLIGNNTILYKLDHPVMCKTALTKVPFALLNKIVFQLVDIIISYYPHFREIIFAFSGTEKFDSIKDVVAKHQQVPVLAWFLTEVVFSSTTGVNLYPSPFFEEAGFFFCASDVMTIRASKSVNTTCFFMLQNKFGN